MLGSKKDLTAESIFFVLSTSLCRLGRGYNPYQIWMNFIIHLAFFDDQGGLDVYTKMG